MLPNAKQLCLGSQKSLANPLAPEALCMPLRLKLAFMTELSQAAVSCCTEQISDAGPGVCKLMTLMNEYVAEAVLTALFAAC